MFELVSAICSVICGLWMIYYMIECGKQKKWAETYRKSYLNKAAEAEKLRESLGKAKNEIFALGNKYDVVTKKLLDTEKELEDQKKKNKSLIEACEYRYKEMLAYAKKCEEAEKDTGELNEGILDALLQRNVAKQKYEKLKTAMRTTILDIQNAIEFGEETQEEKNKECESCSKP